MKDYHAILGVAKDADQEEIRKAYRRLVLKYHPDRNKDPEATERFREVSEAYAALTGKLETSNREPETAPADPSELWMMDVMRRWKEMENEKNNNMYR